MILKNEAISPVSILLYVYLLIISSMYYKDIAKSFRKVIHKNKLLKHLLLFIGIVVILTHVYIQYDMVIILFYAFALYILLLLLFKSDFKWTIGILLSLCIYHIYYLKQKQLETNKLNDKLISNEDKDIIIHKFFKKNVLICSGFVLLIICGSLAYDSKQYGQHKNNYRLNKFLMN
jgi:hypothetical protein